MKDRVSRLAARVLADQPNPPRAVPFAAVLKTQIAPLALVPATLAALGVIVAFGFLSAPDRARTLFLTPRFLILVLLIVVAILTVTLISTLKVAHALRNGLLMTGDVYTVGRIRGQWAGSLRLQMHGRTVEKGFTWSHGEPEYGDQFRVLVVDPGKDWVALTLGPDASPSPTPPLGEGNTGEGETDV